MTNLTRERAHTRGSIVPLSFYIMYGGSHLCTKQTREKEIFMVSKCVGELLFSHTYFLADDFIFILKGLKKGS